MHTAEVSVALVRIHDLTRRAGQWPSGASRTSIVGRGPQSQSWADLPRIAWKKDSPCVWKPTDTPEINQRLMVQDGGAHRLHRAGVHTPVAGSPGLEQPLELTALQNVALAPKWCVLGLLPPQQEEQEALSAL